jgi:LmbE family N-acetylglucosaminyl deacetylase
MIQLSLSRGTEPGLRVLCLGAHSDDIEIGCGGTVLALLRARRDVEIQWTVFSALAGRADEARASAAAFLCGAARSTVDVLGFRDGFFPYQGAEIKEYFEALKGRFAPDVVITHRGSDRHQDHRLLAELAWNTFRSHMVLEYEIPKYDADLAQPNVFVPLEADTRGRKVDLLMEHFGSQRSKSWFTPETFDGLMRLRGIESASPTGYAEAFHARKVTLDLGGGRSPLTHPQPERTE